MGIVKEVKMENDKKVVLDGLHETVERWKSVLTLLATPESKSEKEMAINALNDFDKYAKDVINKNPKLNEVK
jgi:hypothetical protein